MKKYIKSGVSMLGFVGLVFCILLFVVLPVYADSAGIKDVVTNGYFSVMLKDDGSVWAWGYNAHGALGDGTSNNECVPIKVPISDVKEISAGIDHVMALKNDGTVWVWGSNLYGQYGNGTISSVPAGQNLSNWYISSLPTEVPGLNNVKTISANAYNCFVVKNDGTVWAWGDNRLGDLGDGSTTTHSSPVQVKGLANIVDVSGGTHHTLALDNNGNVWAWGYNEDGELGNNAGEQTDQFGYNYNPEPVQVPIDNVASISAGLYVSMALKKDGTLWAWGSNENGELGDGTSTSRSTPARISGLNNVIEMCGPDTTSMALTSDSIMWTWGANRGLASANTGDTSSYRNTFYTPTRVEVIDNVKKFAFKSQVVLALKNDGTLWAWGDNPYGGLGVGNYNNDSIWNEYDFERTTPTRVLTDSGSTAFPIQASPTITIGPAPASDNGTASLSSVTENPNNTTNVSINFGNSGQSLLDSLLNYKFFGFIGLIVIAGIIGYLWKRRYT